MRVLIFVALLLGFVGPAAAETVRMIAFNIERGFLSEAELPTIVDLMDSVGPADIWALSEVSAGDVDYFLKHLGVAYYESVVGTRGSDYLIILFRKRKFSRLDSGEIDLTQVDAGQRKPLWVKLRSKRTGSEFVVLANHLLRGRGDDPRRLNEARDLNRWAKFNGPAIALGDFNLDFDVNYTQQEETRGLKQQSQAYGALVENDRWAWVRPDVLMPTQCSPDYDSVLDFAFVAGAAKNWPRESTILDIGCHDDERRPDHLPVDLRITISR